MGNPHPTKSKPNKIGRKHTQGKRVWQRAKEEKHKKIVLEKQRAQGKRRMHKIKQYWKGEIGTYPS